ncbi:MAG: WD40 repeat domain-containing protein, partial [Cyanobium sp.]
ARPGAQQTIVQLLARYASRLPRWIKVLATSRRRPDVLTPLRQAFSLQELDAEEARNLEDLSTYSLERCRRSTLAERLEQASLSAEEVAGFLSAQEQSSGKFLYVVRVLNDLASGQLPLQSRKDLEQLPPGMDGFYRDAFERRFPNEESYAPVRDLLGVLCEQREPLGRKELAAILSGSGQAIAEREILEWLKPMHDLLRLVSRTEQNNGKPHQIVLHGFDHVSLPQWLSEADEWGYGRADRFMVDRTAAAERIRRWGLAQATSQQAHTWPYLVRHLAAHLTEEERPEVMAGLLGEFTWLEARLRQKGINALLGDFALAAPSLWLPMLERALRQGAYVLSQSDGWIGNEQLASQLLARMPVEANGAERLREQASAWLRRAYNAIPRTTSLLADEDLLRILPVSSDVNSMAALPDGRLAYTCKDNTIRLLDPSSGSCSTIPIKNRWEALVGAEYPTALAVLSDVLLATAGSLDNTIHLWDLATFTCLRELKGHNSQVGALAVLPDGRLSSGSFDCTIRLWDPATGSCERVFEGHQGIVLALTVLPDGRIASGSHDGTIRLWDPSTGACERIFEAHYGAEVALAALPDGRIASSSASIRLWDPATGDCSELSEKDKDGLSDQWPTTLVVLANGSIVSGSIDSRIRLFDPATGSCLNVLNGHYDGVKALAVLPDGRLASASRDNTIRLWDPSKKLRSSDTGKFTSMSECFKQHFCAVEELVLLKDGNLASCARDSLILIWDTGSGSCVKCSVLMTPARVLVALRDGSLVSSSEDHGLCLLDPVTHKCIGDFFGKHQLEVRALIMLPDGRIASGSLDRSIRLWDLATRACLLNLKGHEGGVHALAVLIDGLLASGSDDSTIRLWNLASGSSVAVFYGHQGGVNALALLPDGRLASGSNDSTIRLWDPASGSCLAVFQGHQLGVRALAVLPDGRLASGSDDSTIRLWDPASGSCRAVFEGHQKWVNALAVLPDGRLASSSLDSIIRLWDPASPDGAPQVLFVADAEIIALLVHPTRPLLVAGDSSGRLHWLELPTPSRPSTG